MKVKIDIIKNILIITLPDTYDLFTTEEIIKLIDKPELFSL